MLISVNTAVEVKEGFETIKPGTYLMRVKEVKDRNPQKNDLEVRLEFVQSKEELQGVSGEALKGQPGNIFDYVMLDPEKQWKLRMITEAAGLPWQDYDPVTELVGKELFVVVKTEPYEGELKNKVGRYVIKK